MSTLFVKIGPKALIVPLASGIKSTNKQNNNIYKVVFAFNLLSWLI